MADAERKVTVRIAVVPDQGNAKALATIGKAVDELHNRQAQGAKKAADSSSKEAERAAKAAEREYDKQAAAAQKAYSKIMRERERAAKAEQVAIEKAAKEASAAYEKEAAEAQRAFSRIMREREKQGQQVEALTEKMGSYRKLTIQANLDTAEGAIKAAKGFAEMGLLGAESSETILRGLVAVQGAFDVLEGGFKIWRGIGEAIEVANAALKTQVALEATLQAIRGRGAVAKIGGATASGAAAGVASGLAGAAGAGAVGAGGAGTGMFGGVTAGGLAMGAGIGAAATAAAVGVVELVAGLGKLAGFKWEGPTSAILGWWKATSDAAESTKKLEQAERRREQLREQVTARNAAAAAQDTAFRAGDAGQRTLDTLGGGDASASARAELNRQLERLRQAEDQRSGFKAAGGLDVRGGVDAANQRVVEAQQRILEADKARLEVLRQQKQTQEQGLQTAQRELDTANKALKAEQDRFKSQLARFGALKETEQAELAAIAKIVQQGGKINAAQAGVLQQTGIGGNVAASFFAEQGAAAGGTDILGVLGDGAGVAEAQAAVAAAALEVDSAQKQLAETTAEVTTASQRFGEELNKLADFMNKAFRFANEGNQTPGVTAPSVNSPVAPAPSGPTASADELLETTRQVASAVGTMFDELNTAQRDVLNSIESRRGRASAVAAAQA